MISIIWGVGKEPTPSGTCGAPVDSMDVWGGDVAPPVKPCPTCGLFSLDDCCQLCLQQNEPGAVCDVADLWHEPGMTHGYMCGLKKWAAKTNTTSNAGRTYTRVTRRPSPLPSNNDLCAKNTGVLAVRNKQNGTSVVDLILYNHASFADLIVDCSITTTIAVEMAANLKAATVRRIDETHANPLARWIAMGAPDYTTEAQNAELLASSELIVENLVDIAAIGTGVFTMSVPAHGVAAVRITL